MERREGVRGRRERCDGVLQRIERAENVWLSQRRSTKSGGEREEEGMEELVGGKQVTGGM